MPPASPIANFWSIGVESQNSNFELLFQSPDLLRQLRIVDQFQPMPPVSVLAENVSSVNLPSRHMIPSTEPINIQWAGHAAIQICLWALRTPFLNFETRPQSSEDVSVIV